MTDSLYQGVDPPYLEARRVLLDALFALEPHGQAFIVVGAQAIYLHTGDVDPTIAIAPFTTDGDLALDPSYLGDDPALEDALRGADFDLQRNPAGHVQPGAWYRNVVIEGQVNVVPLDLLVPEASIPKDSHRGVRLGVHGKQAARKVAGLEAALIDHNTMTISALDPEDGRSIGAEVAGPAALFIAKAYKIAERVASGKQNRYDDKDASDVLRLMQAIDPADVAETIRNLLANSLVEESVRLGLDYLRDLFGSRSGAGVAMAHRALREVMPEDRITVICTSYIQHLFDSMDG